MASNLPPFPSPLFPEADPPRPDPPPLEHSFYLVLTLFWFSLILLLLYLCCYPIYESSFGRRDRQRNQRRDIETGQQISTTVAPRRVVRVVLEQELKTFRYTGEEPVGKNSECCVCMDEFSAGDLCTMLGSCDHSFHAQCITPWLTINPECPICRVPAFREWRTEIFCLDEPSPTSDSPRRPPV